jgi:hypothetical protein
MSLGPFTSLFFMISIWIRLTISVSMKSREIKGRGTRPGLYDETPIVTAPRIFFFCIQSLTLRLTIELYSGTRVCRAH